MWREGSHEGSRNSVFLSVSAALVKSDLPVGWVRDRLLPVDSLYSSPIAHVPLVIWVQADPCDLFYGPTGAGPYRIYELDCFRSVKA